MASDSLSPQRIFLVDAPRTCSQVFNKIFLNHPQLGHVFHPIITAMYGPERVTLSLKHCQEAEKAQIELSKRTGMMDTYDDAVARMVQDIAEIEKKGKIPWIKDHTCCHIHRDIAVATAKSSQSTNNSTFAHNPTCFPDDLFQTFTPIILIRHPLLMIRSCYRTQFPVFKLQATDEDVKFMTTLSWSKLWFDVKRKEKDGQIPIVIDAEDVVYNTKVVVEELCERLGLDKGGVQYEWPPVPEEERPDDPIMKGFFVDMLNSSGVNRATKPAEKSVDIDEQMQLWKAEFGQEAALALRKRVDEEMPTYEYLKGFKMEMCKFKGQ